MSRTENTAQRFVIAPIPVTLTPEEVLKHYHADPEDEAAEELTAMTQAFNAVAAPKAVCRVLACESDGVTLKLDGELIPYALPAKNLKDMHRAFAYVVTCGTEAADWAEGLAEDPVEAFWADGIQEMLLYKANGWFQSFLKETYLPGGQFSRMSPGSLKEWPLQQQEVLFRLIGRVTEDIGVTLQPSFLMKPFKSVSGLAYSGGDGFVNCRLCPMTACPNRQAPMDADYARERFGVQL